MLPSAAAPTFDHPLEMLRACHGKILRQCETLQKLGDHLKTDGCDEQVQQAARNMLRYFDTSGQFHHHDEEEDLFPALRAAPAGECDQASVDALLQRLLDQHIVLLACWAELRAVLLRLADGEYAPLNDELARRFVEGYSGHIEIENGELLPLAARLLPQETLRAIGVRMAVRRGAQPPSPLHGRSNKP